MRIIAGDYKGKKLFLPNDKLTRPLKDLVKESIFNLIKHSKKINIDMSKSKILDLFSGTGSFGLECLSRGAEKVVFLENYPEAIKILEKNIKSLKNLKNYKIFKKDCYDFSFYRECIDIKFDIIFIDPPYKDIKINILIEELIDEKILNTNGIIIIHRNKKDKLKITDKLNIFEKRTYGLANLFFGN